MQKTVGELMSLLEKLPADARLWIASGFYGDEYYSLDSVETNQYGEAILWTTDKFELGPK